MHRILRRGEDRLRRFIGFREEWLQEEFGGRAL